MNNRVSSRRATPDTSPPDPTRGTACGIIAPPPERTGLICALGDTDGDTGLPVGPPASAAVSADSDQGQGRIVDVTMLLKQLLVDTALERLGRRISWILQTPQRLRHPELWDMYLEDRRTSVALPELVTTTDNCVDVGAHVGSKLAELRRLAPEGSHIAFEPVPSKARWLRRKFTDVRVIEAATSDESGSGRFYIDLEQPGFSGLTEPVGGSRTEATEVRLVRLDDELVDCDRIDFLKVDVEGAELPTLRGAEKTLDRHHPTMLFECGTDPQLARFDYRRVDLYDFLAERDYDIYSVADFVYGRPPMTREGFEIAGTYPYRGFNYVALPAGSSTRRLL